MKVKSLVRRLKKSTADSFLGLGMWLVKSVIASSSGKFFSYQPMPWIGYPGKRRAESTYLRLEAMKPHMPPPPASILDIGCNTGYNLISFAKAGYSAFGVDVEPRFKLIFDYAIHKSATQKAAMMVDRIDPLTISSLPKTDVVILQSVYHHWCSAYGISNARAMLAEVWDKTGSVLFFEGGEDKEAGLGVDGDLRKWNKDQLQSACRGGEIVEVIETLKREDKNNSSTRMLYKVKRQLSI